MNETMQLYGVKANGETVLLGDAPITPQMKQLDLVRSHFGATSENADEGTDADMCLWTLQEYHQWLVAQGWACKHPLVGQPPAPNSLWRHTNGNVYKVATITNVGSTKPEYPLTVVYFNVANDTWWSRPVSEWHRSMTPADQ